MKLNIHLTPQSQAQNQTPSQTATEAAPEALFPSLRRNNVPETGRKKIFDGAGDPVSQAVNPFGCCRSCVAGVYLAELLVQLPTV